MSTASVPAFRLRPHDRGVVVGQWGGVPRLPPHQDWPLNAEGEPLTFMGSLDLDALHQIHPLPDWMAPTGEVVFFYDAEKQPGYTAGQRAGWRVWHIGGDAETAEVPASVEPVARLPLEAVVFDSVASPDRDARTPTAAWEQFLGDLPPERHQFLGYPTAIQDDDSDARAARHSGSSVPADQWALLWAVDSDAALGWEWGDSGTLFLWVQPERVRRGEWAHAEVVIDSY